jgi:hypothetical protein
MNIAFPAFFILILILPGFIFLNAYERKESSNLTSKPFEVSSASALLIAFIIQTIFSAFIHFNIKPIDFDICFKLLTGFKLTNDEYQDIGNSSYGIAIYMMLTFLLSYLLGKLAQYIVFKFNPYKSSRFAFNTPWYYELKGQLSATNEAQIIKLSCLQDNKEGTYLYYGILEDFYLNKDGQLDRLVLSDVSRRHITADDNNSSNNDRYYQIKGNRLLLKYENILNLNIEYLYIRELLPVDIIDDTQ